MSKRYPLSRASKEYNRLCEIYPSLSAQLKPFSSLDTEDDETILLASNLLLEFCLKFDTTPEELAAKSFFDPDHISPLDLGWLSRWQRCRQVFQIDPEVAHELAEQPLDEKLPSGLLSHLPYPVMYIDNRVPVSFTDQVRYANGFFVFRNHDATGDDDLAFIYLMEDGDRLGSSLTVNDGWTLSDCIDHVFEFDSAVAEVSPNFFAADQFDMTVRNRYRECITVVLNLLLFIISQENGSEVIYAPPKQQRGQKIGKRSNPETVTQVGAKLGRAIGAARRASQASASSESTGRTVAPHIRRAHWQSFWTGQRKNRTDNKFGDELVVRWIPPIEVNANNRGESIETIHR